MRRASVLPVVAALACGVAACGHPGPAPRTERTLGLAPAADLASHREGVVAVANPFGAEAGARILERGGNAVDAAVAIAYALNVVEPQSAGIGGGGLMLIHLARSGETVLVDSRETAPAGASPAMFAGVPDPSLQGVAVGVPGMVRGTALALETYGRLPLATVLEPAIALADTGFAATPRYARVSCNARSMNSPEAAAHFCPGGVAPVAGTRVLNRPLAATLRAIAAHGPDCFYRDLPEQGCDIARGIVAGQHFRRTEPGSRGGSMTLADLAGYRAVIRVPVSGSYRGYRIVAAGPPSSGGLTVLQMLKLVERFPLGDAGQGFGFGSLATVTVMADAMRVAFADRSVWMGDADFAAIPIRGLLDPAYVAQRSAPIRPGARVAPDPQPDDPRRYQGAAQAPAKRRLAVAEPVTGPGETTTHFSVVDRDGNMVAYTNTIESPHGIGVFAGYRNGDGSFKNLGFLLNNELTDFNLAPTVHPFTGSSGFNDVLPGKRPRSSMTPVMIFTPEGRPLIAFGSPGGATIINSVFNVALNLIDHGMTLQAAIDAPRVSAAGAGSMVTVEPGMAPATVEGLRALGYTVNSGEIGSVQAVLVDPRTGRQAGAADSRREGTVIGLPRP